jgi:hypothetical protein
MAMEKLLGIVLVIGITWLMISGVRGSGGPNANVLYPSDDDGDGEAE